MPLVGAIFGDMDFSNLFVLLGAGPRGLFGPDDLCRAQGRRRADVGYGQFLTALVNFLILAFIIFLLVKAATRAMAAEAGGGAGGAGRGGGAAARDQGLAEALFLRGPTLPAAQRRYPALPPAPGRRAAVLLVHPGGPFWRGKDDGAWMIPKGMVEPGEDPARRRPARVRGGARRSAEGAPGRLCEIRQKGGKWVEAFALEGDFDPASSVSNMIHDRIAAEERKASSLSRRSTRRAGSRWPRRG